MFSGTLISILVPTILFGVLTILMDETKLSFDFLVLMAIAGIFNFLIARTAFYTAIYRIGVNLTAPLSATRIYFAIVLGVLIGEYLSIKLILMTFLIFTGIFLLSKPSKIKADLIGIFLAIFAGLFSALSSFFVKLGMAIYPEPVLG
ncbi:hypothetical protein DRP07_01785, partial [Archaeoglobales archaeon]